MEKLKACLDFAQEKYVNRKKEYEAYISGIKDVYCVNGTVSLDQETLLMLIDRIVIDPTGDFEITWNFEKGFARKLQNIEKERRTYEKSGYVYETIQGR